MAAHKVSRRATIGLVAAVVVIIAAVSTAVLLHDSGSGGSHRQLPLTETTGDATQVITVTAASERSTTATLQAWNKVKGAWVKVGAATTAHLGAGGLTVHEQETSTQTPIGSFTLTQAFGRLANPGTSLPYFTTTPNDWWVSQEGPYYNSHVRCRLRCPFVQGSPNARLFYTVPQYDLAVVIDYNRFPAIPNLGSGIFLHVTRGIPTAGCISINVDPLTTIVRWLKPADHPRILIGVAS